MEIPYTVTARPDTGLWNAKVGIWLFLASEVMLFGGLFSSYVFLRLGADFPWPKGDLTVPFGFVNTLILIASSVFVVYAWVMLKMRNYLKYRIWMGLVVLCALMFLINKGFEYYAKFTHYHAELTDHSVVAGHIESKADKSIVFDASTVTIDYVTGGQHFLKYLHNDDDDDVTFTTEKGTEVSVNRGLFNRLRTARERQNEADELAIAGQQAKADELNASIKADYPLFTELDGGTSLVLNASPAAHFVVPRKAVASWSENQLGFATKYAASLGGTLNGDVLTISIDELDLRKYLRHDDPRERKIEDAAVFKYMDDSDRAELLEQFKAHRAEAMKEHLEHVAAWKEKNPGEAYPEKPFYDFDRLKLKDVHEEESGDREQHAATGGDGEDHGPTLKIPFSDIRYFSNYGPNRNNFYAIYFTMTGLHGLHVLGGMLVLGYFWLFGHKLYRKNPEHLANRVEVGGLFWHFVDLVWIFLFPIFYLM